MGRHTNGVSKMTARGTEYFEAECPYCSRVIRGSWNWQIGRLCVQGYCNNCRIFILEDEASWEKVVQKDDGRKLCKLNF